MYTMNSKSTKKLFFYMMIFFSFENTNMIDERNIFAFSISSFEPTYETTDLVNNIRLKEMIKHKVEGATLRLQHGDIHN
jgi:hypothetical protein